MLNLAGLGKRCVQCCGFTENETAALSGEEFPVSHAAPGEEVEPLGCTQVVQGFLPLTWEGSPQPHVLHFLFQRKFKVLNACENNVLNSQIPGDRKCLWRAFPFWIMEQLKS